MNPIGCNDRNTEVSPHGLYSHNRSSGIGSEFSAKPVNGTTRARPSALFILGSRNYKLIYGSAVRSEIARLTNILGPAETRDTIHRIPDLLAEVEVIFTGWEAPVFDAQLLRKTPRLKAVFHGSGSIRPFVSEAFWDREIIISSAREANAIPVAEYSMGVILLSLKHFWRFSMHAKSGGEWGDQHRPMPGCYGSTVGFVSFGMVARKLLSFLEPYELRRLVYCPFLANSEASRLNVELCDLREVFRRSDVVTLHTPHMPQTHGLVTGEHIASMRAGATLVNTARGGIIREEEMIEVLKSRPDLTAVLDVTDPEPPDKHSPLLQLPNVVLSPHIAGSHDRECRRMGVFMLDELRRYLAGEPLLWQITREMNAVMA